MFVETLHRQIARARFQLSLELFLRRLRVCCCWALSLAAIAIAVGKWRTFGIDPRLWGWSWLGGSLAIGLLAALVWTLLRRHSAIEAAIEIDRRFALRERVSSSLALSQSELESQAGQALMSDTLRRIDKLDVAGAF